MAREISKEEFVQRVTQILADRLMRLPDPHVGVVGGTVLSAVPAPSVGSCTFPMGGAMRCVDGVTQNQCEGELGGTWDPVQTCAMRQG
jgi:hypothetical protein